MSFIITESPAKAKKIQGFLGQGYTVKSSVGHIRGIDTKWANTDVKIDGDFEFWNTNPTDFKLEINGSNFDQIESYWVSNDDYNNLNWYLYGPSNLNEYTMRGAVYCFLLSQILVFLQGCSR